MKSSDADAILAHMKELTPRTFPACTLHLRADFLAEPAANLFGTGFLLI